MSLKGKACVCSPALLLLFECKIEGLAEADAEEEAGQGSGGEERTKYTPEEGKGETLEKNRKGRKGAYVF